jgi:hypothetical protein
VVYVWTWLKIAEVAVNYSKNSETRIIKESNKGLINKYPGFSKLRDVFWLLDSG